MTGPMPSLLPGYSRCTALASTCAAEWRITSSSACETLLPLWLMRTEPPIEEMTAPLALGRGAHSRFHPSSARGTLHASAQCAANGAANRGQLLDLAGHEAVRCQAHRWFSSGPATGLAPPPARCGQQADYS